MTNTNTLNFSLEYPSVAPEWFDEYYRRHEYVEDEELLERELRCIRPPVDNGRMSEDYRTFFSDLYDFWRAYTTVCSRYHIRPLFRQPELPEDASELQDFTNDTILAWRKDTVRAMIHLFETRNLFLHKSVEDYLEANDEARLDVAEFEKEDEEFQLMLIMNVGLRVDLENVVLCLKTYWPKYALPRPRPRASVNPWLAGQVAMLRTKHSGEELSAQYREELRVNERLRWSTFLCARALKEALRRDPALATRTRDLDLPEAVRDKLLYNELEVLLDLVQLPAEMLRRQNRFDDEDFAVVVAFLKKAGYPPLSAKENVFVHFLQELH